MSSISKNNNSGSSASLANIVFPVSYPYAISSNVQELSEFTNSNSVALAIAITVTQINTACLIGMFVPAGYYLRIRTNNTTGSPTFNFRSGQEVIL